MTADLIYEQRDGIGQITINHPQARNALTFPMYERLAEIAASPGNVGALILTGAGEKAFAAGTDINQLLAFSAEDDGLQYEARIDRVLNTLE
jgi:enoyl-CoA hydratase/carnithine racemase